MNARPAEAPLNEEPNIRGFRVRPSWPMALYALLVLSAALSLYVQRAPGVDPLVARFAPWLFLVFGVGFAAYRVALVAARRYSPFKAFLQVLLAALFFLLLVNPRAQQLALSQPLLRHNDARVRALAAENVGLRGDVTKARELPALLDDGDEAVQKAAHEALIRLNDGADLGKERTVWEARFP